MNIIWLLCGGLCLAYFLAAKFVGMDFAIVWLAGAVVFFGIVAVQRYMGAKGLHLPHALKVTGIVLLSAGILLFAAVEGVIIHGMTQKGEPDLEYVIVLGAQVRGNTPSRALVKRLQTARDYLQENPDTKAVLSGGKGDGEHISEAEAMRIFLTEAGISEDRLILEDQSTTTQENLAFTAELIHSKDAKVGIISNNFHIFRAVRLAEKQGYTKACGIAAPSDPIWQVHYMVREFFAILKEFALGNI